MAKLRWHWNKEGEKEWILAMRSGQALRRLPSDGLCLLALTSLCDSLHLGVGRTVTNRT